MLQAVNLQDQKDLQGCKLTNVQHWKDLQGCNLTNLPDLLIEGLVVVSLKHTLRSLMTHKGPADIQTHTHTHTHT